MRTKYYYYEFSDNFSKYMSPQEAYEYCASNGVSATQDGLKKAIFDRTTMRTKKDGFQSGWNYGLGEYVRGQKHYSQLMNQKGLTEVGKEKIDQIVEPKQDSFLNDDTMRMMNNEMDIKVSDREAEALIDGKIEVN